MTPAQFAARLEAKPAGSAKWLANCPAHDDRRPSLSIAEGKEGRILLKCFAGCAAAEIVAGMGLELRDLFDRPPREYGDPPRPRLDLKRLADVIDEAAMVLRIGHADLAAGELLEPKDAEAMTTAQVRLVRVAGLLRHAR